MFTFTVRMLLICILCSGLSKIYIVSLSGRTVRTFGQFSKEVLSGTFNEPSGVSVDSSGNIVIADSRNNRLQVRTLADVQIITCVNTIFFL